MKAFLLLVLLAGLGFLGYQQLGSQQHEHLSSPLTQLVTEYAHPQESSRLHSQLNIVLENPAGILNAAHKPSLQLDSDSASTVLKLRPVNIELVSDDKVYFNYHVDVPGGAKGANQALQVFSNITLELDNDWCMRPSVTTKYKWRKAAAANSDDQSTRRIESVLAGHSRKLGQAVAKTIDCQLISRHVQTLWEQRNYEFELPGKREPNVKLDMITTDIGYLGVTFGNRVVSINFQADFVASTRGIKLERSNTVPGAKMVSKKSNQLSFNMALLGLKYDKLKAILREKLVGTSLSTRTKYGTYSFKINQLRVFPHKQELVLALNLDVSNTEEWIGKKGWVYLLLVPGVDQDGGALGLKLKGFSQGMEPGLSLGLAEGIGKKLQHISLVNSANDLANYVRLVGDNLGKTVDGNGLSLTGPGMILGNVVLTGSELAVDAIYSAAVEYNAKSGTARAKPAAVDNRKLTELQPLQPLEPIEPTRPVKQPAEQAVPVLQEYITE